MTDGYAHIIALKFYKLWTILVSATAEYFDNIECVNKAGPDLDPCITSMFVGLHRAAHKAKQQPKIAYTCW